MIVIVSGNMRCGSSLVMRMLGAGGLPLSEPREREIKRTCNRHVDCDEAERKLIAAGKSRPFINFHCHDDCCEECFGY